MLSVADAEARMNGRTRKYKKILETLKNSTSVDVNCSSREIDKKTKRCHGWTPLTRACSENKYFNARLLLELNADVNESNRVGETPLYWAIYNENIDIVKLLLQYNVDVNKKMNNFEGRTPLHYINYIAWNIHYKFLCTGIKSDDVAINDIAILLLQHNANINATNNSGNTPLNIFSDGGNFNLAKILLEHSADINIANNKGNTPLHSSYVPNDDFKIFKLLLEYNPDVNIANKRGETPLHLACSHRNFEIFKLLIDRNADVNVADNDGQTPLHLASQYKYGTETVEILIKNNADVNKTNKGGETPLYLASCRGHSDIINLLLNHNADVNISDNHGNTPLNIVANNYDFETRCYTEIAKKLIKHKADINKTNKSGETAVNLASRFAHSDMVNLLLQQNADVNIEDKINRRTPLHKASLLGRKEIVKMILEKKHNADINKTDNNEATALLLASIYGHSCIVNLLLQHNADANIADVFGKTPLHYTSHPISNNYDIEIAEILIQCNNIDINKTDKEGATALHFASDIGNSNIVNLLLQHNADVNITDVNGKTPLQLALLKEHTVIIDLLKQYTSCEKRKLILESQSSVQPQNKKFCK